MSKMFTTKNKVRLHDTDAMGILYYPQLFRFAQDALEDYLESVASPIAKVWNETPYFLPIVHVESNYLQPLLLGDEITVTMQVEHVGETSITLLYHFIKEEKCMANAKIVHVSVDKKTGKKCPIPDEVLKWCH